MAYLLQVDFPFEGPFGEEMEKGFWDLAKVLMKKKDSNGKYGLRMKKQKKLEASMYLKKNKMLKNTRKCTRTDLKQLVLKILE